MRTRIADLLGSEPSGMWTGTFHSIGARLLRINAPLVGRTQSFTIYDEDDTLAAVKHVMERLRISTEGSAAPGDRCRHLGRQERARVVERIREAGDGSVLEVGGAGLSRARCHAAPGERGDVR